MPEKSDPVKEIEPEVKKEKSPVKEILTTKSSAVKNEAGRLLTFNSMGVFPYFESSQENCKEASPTFTQPTKCKTEQNWNSLKSLFFFLFFLFKQECSFRTFPTFFPSMYCLCLSVFPTLYSPNRTFLECFLFLCFFTLL